MRITLGEYCRFSLSGRLQLAKEFGILQGEMASGTLLIHIYKICDFFVEIRFEQPHCRLVYAEPFKSMSLLNMYLDSA